MRYGGVRLTVKSTPSMVNVVVAGVKMVLTRFLTKIILVFSTGMVWVRFVKVVGFRLASLMENVALPLLSESLMLITCVPTVPSKLMMVAWACITVVPIWIGEVKTSGFTSCVVLMKVPVTFPMLRVEVVAAPRLLEEVWVTVTLSPFFTVPAESVGVPELMEYLLLLPTEPMTLMGLESALMPDTVMGSEVISELTAVPVFDGKENGSGVVASLTNGGNHSTLPHPAMRRARRMHVT